MSRKIITVTFDGEPMSLKEWCTRRGVNYHTVRLRYRDGAREAGELLAGLAHYELRPIPEADIEWLRETRFARAGLTYEWKIACDLIGVPRCLEKDVRKAVEGAIS